MYENAKFDHQVVGAKWDDLDGKWTVQVKDLQTGEVKTDSGEVLINCGGALKSVRITFLLVLNPY